MCFDFFYTWTKMMNFELSINDVPNEILYIIFNLLSNKTLLDCTRVCRAWMILAGYCCSSTLTVDRNNQFEFISQAQTILRHHKKLSIQHINLTALTPNLGTIFGSAQEVSLQDVTFADLATLITVIRACGDLRHLDMDTPVVKNRELEPVLVGEEPVSTIEEFDLILRDEEDVTWEVLRAFQFAGVRVKRLYLFLDLEMEFREVAKMCSYLTEHCQAILKRLKISKWNTDGTMVAPVVLSHLTHMSDLQLELFSCEEPVDNMEFAQFVQKNWASLRVLELGNFNAVQWTSIVSCCAGLEELFLKIRQNVEFPDVNFKITALSRLKKVTLALHQENVTQIDVTCLAWLPDLEHLSIDDKNENRPIFRFSEIGPRPLVKLKELFLGHLTIGYEVFQTIFKFMTNLEVLVLYCIFGVERNGLLGNKQTGDLSIAALRRLRFLAIDSYGVNDEVLKEMKLPGLKHLEFYGFLRIATYTNSGLVALRKNCPLLKEVITDQQTIDLESLICEGC